MRDYSAVIDRTRIRPVRKRKTLRRPRSPCNYFNAESDPLTVSNLHSYWSMVEGVPRQMWLSGRLVQLRVVAMDPFVNTISAGRPA